MTRRMASRLGLVTTSPTIAIKMEAERLRREGREVIDFGPGEPDLPTPEPAKAAGVRAIEEDFTHYTGAAGIMPLRRAIAEHYADANGVEIAPEEVLVGVGGKGVLFSAMFALLNPGDEAVIVAPYWVSFPEQIRLAGGSPVVAATSAEDGFSIRAAEIEKVLTPATTMVIVNSPSNPSGGVMPREEAEKLVELCIERDLWLVSDETYESFVYDEADRYSLLSYRERLGDRLVYVSAFSKTYAMTGWRVGYGVSSKAVTKAMITIQSHDSTHTCSVAQKAALAAIEKCSEVPQERLELYRERRNLVVSGLNDIPGVSCPVPRGAFYAYPDVRELAARKGLSGSMDLSRALIGEEAVATVPGEAFGTPGYLRISYATSEDNIREGLSRLARFAKG